MRYTLDTNILINLENRYPREIYRGGDQLLSWAKNLSGFVCKVTDQELATVKEIASAHPEWIRGQKNEGDPFIIAHAKYEGSMVVTEEIRKGRGTIDKNQKIPNIADEHGVKCLTFFEYVKAQDWKF